MSTKFYIYTHHRADNDQIFYVGKGQGKRAYSVSGRSTYWKRITKKYGFTTKVIYSGLTEQEAFEKEIELIKEYGRIDLGSGCLVNHTDGGAGTAKFTLTQEQRDSRSKSHIGLRHSEETKIKISLGNIGKKYSEESKLKISTNRQKLGNKLPRINKIGFRGVYKNGPSFAAQIFLKGVKYSKGCFKTPEDAAKWYDEKVIELFGKTALTNFIKE